jgi:hypothetical protein
MLSFPHLVQRIALPSERAIDPFCIIRRRLATSRLRKDDHDTPTAARAAGENGSLTTLNDGRPQMSVTYGFPPRGAALTLPSVREA